MQGTAFAGNGRGKGPEKAWLAKRLRRDHAGTLRRGKRERTVSARWEWMDYNTYEEWFEGWEKFSLEKKYALPEPEYDEAGNQISDIRYPLEKKRRIINLDETEIPLDASKRRSVAMATRPTMC